MRIVNKSIVRAIRIVFFGLLLLVIFVVNTFGQFLEYSNSSLWSNVTAIKASGNYAYCQFTEGLGILDISDPANPSLIGKFAIPGYSLAIDVSGSYAFVAASDGLRIYNVYSPQNTVLLSIYNGHVSVRDVCASGAYAYLAAQDQFEIVDISNPYSPYRTGYIDQISASIVAAADGYAYISDNSQPNYRVNIINVQNAANPDLITQFQASNFVSDLAVQGDRLYVLLGDAGTMNGGIQIFDISNPNNPNSLGELDIFGSPRNIEIAGSYAYIANLWRGLDVIDISNPESPTLVAERITTAAFGVSVSGDYAFVADEPFGVIAFDKSDPQNPEQIGGYQPPGEIWNLTVVDTLLYVAELNKAMSIVNIADPAHPNVIGQLSVYNIWGDILVNGGYAYIKNYSHLLVINITDPTNPSLVTSFYPLGCAMCQAIRGNYAFLSEGDCYSPSFTGMEIIDITDPSSPISIGSYATPGTAMDLKLVGNYAFIIYRYANENPSAGMQVVDISDLENPQFVAGYDLHSPASMEIVGNYVFIADEANGLKIVDISDPANPTFEGRYTPYSGNPQHVSISGNYAFLSNRICLTAVDVSDPSNPSFVDQFCTPGQPMMTDVAGHDIYLADRYALTVLRFTGNCTGVSGDANDDGAFNSLDIEYSINYFKGSQAPPPCQLDCSPNELLYSEADANGDCRFNGFDITYGVNYLKGNGPAPESCPDCHFYR